MAPETSQLDQMRKVSDDLYPKPLVLFNPKWGFEEEKDLDAGLGAFAGSFEVVYSFVGLEVRGVLSRRKGMVFRWVKDGVFGGEGWVVLMEDETKKAELKVVTTVQEAAIHWRSGECPVQPDGCKFSRHKVCEICEGFGLQCDWEKREVVSYICSGCCFLNA